MKQVWYFSKWIFAKCGWAEVLWFALVFSAVPAMFSSNPVLKEVFQYILGTVAILFLVIVLTNSIRFLWRQFKDEQAKMFDVLKKD